MANSTKSTNKWLAMGLGLFFVFGIGIYLSKYFIKTRTYNISSAFGLKIVFISDIHIGVGKYERWVESVVSKVNAQNPDIVIIGGDFIDKRKSPVSELKPLSNLKAKYGVYAVLGNHDYKNIDTVVSKINELGIKLLVNKQVVLDTPKGTVLLTGLDDLWYGEKYDPEKLKPVADYNVLICHNPAILYDTTFVSGYQLVLSGHTHGGQGCYFGFCPVWPFPDLERKYRTGLFDICNSTTLIISSGVGEAGLPLRMFVRSTMEVIHL